MTVAAEERTYTQAEVDAIVRDLHASYRRELRPLLNQLDHLTADVRRIAEGLS